MIYLGTDHAGFRLKEAVKRYFEKKAIAYQDLGAKKLVPRDDYPAFAWRVAKKVVSKPGARGILFDGSGIGMCIAAGKVKGVRCATVWDPKVAQATRRDNDSNVLSLPARFISQKTALRIIEVWLKTPFSKAVRHKRRLKQIAVFEKAVFR